MADHSEFVLHSNGDRHVYCYIETPKERQSQEPRALQSFQHAFLQLRSPPLLYLDVPYNKNINIGVE